MKKKIDNIKGSNFRKNKFGLLFLLLMCILIVFPTLSYASGESMDYEDLLMIIREEWAADSHKNFYTPYPAFEVKAGDQTFYAGPTGDVDYDNTDGNAAIRVLDAGEIPLGTEIIIRDKSTTENPGSKIIKRDFQVTYWNNSGQRYKTDLFNQEVVTAKPTEPGYIFIFLNVQDDYKVLGKDGNYLNFNNWSEKGNWRNPEAPVGSQPGSGIKLRGWYFTVLRLKVVGNDLAMKEPIELLDEKNVKVEVPKKNTPYKLRFSVEQPSGNTNIGLDPATNPKATIDVEVQDGNRKVIHTETITANYNLYPGAYIQMPLTKSFSTDTTGFTVCATINPIHKQLGHNFDDTNDRICKTFSADNVDIGMESSVKLLNSKNQQVNNFTKGDATKLIFSVKHIQGSEAVGLNSSTNPKATINVVVKDGNGATILTNKIQTPNILNPNATIEMPATSSFTTNTGKVTACAVIDNIHKTKGYNENPSNDEVCVDYNLDTVDIGVASIELLRGSNPVKFLDPKQQHSVRFSVKHLAGEESVGLNNTTNPKVKLNIEVFDVNGNALAKQTVQATSVLNKDSTITLPISKTFNVSSGQVKVCGTIDKSHQALGYNDDPTNDSMCATYTMIKNYSIKDVKVSPQTESLPKNTSSVKKPVSVTFTVTNDSDSESGALLSNPMVSIKYRNKEVWKGTVGVPAGQSITRTVSLGSQDIHSGDNKIAVEVNPSRSEVEFIPGVSNPYSDNIGTQNISADKYQDCIKCDRVRTNNTWRERFYFTEQKGTVRNGTFDHCENYERYYRWHPGYWEDDYRYGCSTVGGKRECGWEPTGSQTWVPGWWEDRCHKWAYNVPYQYCVVQSFRAWHEDVDYSETFQIKNVFFRSKFTEDNKGKGGINSQGWIDLKNGSNIGKVRIGYGFELNIVTEYVTNRDYVPTPHPYQRNYYQGDRFGVHPSGYCDYATRSHGITPVDSPGRIYMTLPNMGNDNKQVCHIVTPISSSGSWANNKKTFALPVSGNANNVNNRQVFIGENAKAGVYNIDIVTPKWYGYQPVNAINLSNKKDMQDCTTVKIEILLPDDINSHIIQ